MYVLIRSQTVGAAMSRTAPTAIPFVVLLLFCFCLLFFCAILLHAPLLFCCYSAIDLCAAMQNRISTDTATKANLGHTDKQAATYTHECFFLLHLTHPGETKVYMQQKLTIDPCRLSHQPRWTSVEEVSATSWP